MVETYSDWKNSQKEKAEKNLEIAKKLEKEQKKTRHWVRKDDKTWIFTPKKLSDEKAIKKHN